MRKLYVALTVAFGAFLVGTGVASATPTTLDPGDEAKALFDSSWPQVLDMIKTMAPVVILAGLTLLAIRKVVGAIRRGKAPSF